MLFQGRGGHCLTGDGVCVVDLQQWRQAHRNCSGQLTFDCQEVAERLSAVRATVQGSGIQGVEHAVHFQEEALCPGPDVDTLEMTLAGSWRQGTVRQQCMNAQALAADQALVEWGERKKTRLWPRSAGYCSRARDLQLADPVRAEIHRPEVRVVFLDGAASDPQMRQRLAHGGDKAVEG
ncbi:hypothetical protein D3C77_573420 [compost metagenome]